ncbi:alpha/beta hydrolase [Polyangium aurulentum]|uniref:alpha/beta hydrolase n=1 Tax=Polyangium aurulentum TaxID=2567896 RepID=UPI00146CFA1B|nr:alpha/beta hydrolase-fold protein [Polyangium aurulentum]UQA61987.1 hypothetical protein E8A73_016535 [Polyangium aurulentum]
MKHRSSSSSRYPLAFLTIALVSALAACGGEEPGLSSGSGEGLGGSGLAGSGAGGAGQGGADQGGGGQGGAGLTACTDTPAKPILTELRANLDAGMLKHAAASGWPVQVSTGCYLFVSTDAKLDRLAGDHNGWMGETMKADTGFRWLVRGAAAGNKYKFTNGTDWVADRWSRSYNYDGNGEISLILPSTAHLDRHFNVAGAGLPGRTVRVWVPVGTRTHVLYVHDGQNLFDPYSAWGGWHLQDAAPAGMLLVGIDNTPGRMDEYTHVQDKISGFGAPLGGKGDAYADFIKNTVRPLVKAKYGEPTKVGTMGSSLGGLISFHLADKNPGDYIFAASLSGTMGWGKIGATNQTIIERFVAHGHGTTKLYLDSGGGYDDNGNQVPCADTDGDGIKDDVELGDNYCENIQMRDTLAGLGYQFEKDLWHWWEPNAPHNEAAWKDRVFRPLQIFAGL